MQESTNCPDPLLTLLQIEKEARHALTPDAFRFTAVNRTRLLLPYRQAVLLRHKESGKAVVEALSDVAVVDTNAPFVQLLTRLGTRLFRDGTGRELHQIKPASLSESDRKDWNEWLAPQTLWCPLSRPDGRLLGALLLSRDDAWEEPERILAERLADSLGHAWGALAASTGKPVLERLRPSLVFTLVMALAVGALFLPVRQSVLAPAEVTAREPVVVSAPMDGVISNFHISPNQQAAKDDPLFSFEETDLASRLKVARQTLAVAETRLKTAAQGAFHDSGRSAEKALLKAQTTLRRLELEYAQSLMERVTMRAERSGLAIFRDENDWIGRPVKTGQRILLLADPGAAELRIHLPVREAIVLQPGSEVRFFQDVDPLHPLAATLDHASYQAEPGSDGVMAYRVTAQFGAKTVMPRIGLQGTAKIFGADVPLYMHLFRRPISAARQMIGF